jgi:hypothetical protein
MTLMDALYKDLSEKSSVEADENKKPGNIWRTIHIPIQ